METAVIIEPPVSRRKISVDEYYAMHRAGIFGENERLELIEGELIAMAAMEAPHFSHVMRTARLFIEQFGRRANVSIQSPLPLNAYSEPEPDIAVLKWREDDYFSGKPTPADVLLVVEVADTSLLYDRRTKLPLYARHNIPEVWILNLLSKQLEVYRSPKENDYAEKLMLNSSERVQVQAFADISFAVSDMMIQPR